ncbi:MAG: hypothetical protein E7387_05590 [Ruminococcaceae bacterium]|nr:hypothetical protein [Oscillospiraceae bacterium]
MNKDRYERNDRSSRRTFGSKSLVLVLTCVLIIGSAIGGTIAWLTADAGEVVNTFTESDIDITLSETLPDGQTAQMVPGCTIEKNPTVKVEEGSEGCWLFVKITESTSPALDDYIAYAITTGWEVVVPESNGVTVIGRIVRKDDTTKEFGILGAGEYTDDMGTADTGDDYKISWDADQVCVKPSVTEDMMAAISTQKPTLTFKAYAVQLYKNATTEFTNVEAWARAGALG